MRKRVSYFVATFLLTVLVSSVTAYMQTGTNQKKAPLSPPATAEATIGGKKVSIAYSAPSMRGRKIMGELVPYDKVWRTGANSATTLVTEADLQFGDVRVPKGTYTLYTLPGQAEWKLIVNKQTGQWGTEYGEGQDVGRIAMQVKQASAPMEKFTISVEPAGDKGGLLKMAWENTEASVPFTVAQ